MYCLHRRHRHYNPSAMSITMLTGFRPRSLDTLHIYAKINFAHLRSKLLLKHLERGAGPGGAGGAGTQYR